MKRLLPVFDFGSALFIAALSLSFSASVPAQTPDDYYGGISMRHGSGWLSPNGVSARFDAARFDALFPLSEVGLLFPTPQSYQIKIGYGIGYDYPRRFAVEAEYSSLGRLPIPGMPLVPAALSGLNTRGFGVDAVGMLPFWYRFALLGKAGLRRLTFDGDGSSAPTVSRGALLQGKVGLGLQYNYSGSLGFRAEVERYRQIGTERTDADGDAFSLGVTLRF